VQHVRLRDAQSVLQAARVVVHDRDARAVRMRNARNAAQAVLG
jgi:hypothetical protein